jgi:hypothetical protein
MDRRQRLLRVTDRTLAVLIVTLVLGTTLAFGGAVWWAKPAVAVVTLAAFLLGLGRVALEGVWRLPESPLVPLGALAIALGFVQLAPWPATVAARVSPRAAALYGEAAPAGGRMPLTVDRSATLRWIVGAAGCLAVFCLAAQYADRLGHSVVVWGSVVAALFVCATIGAVQLVGGVKGLYGFIEPGNGGVWTPSSADLLAVPNRSVLRPVERSEWVARRPDRPTAIGSLMGGPGAFVALGSLGIPLALGLTLHLLVPRGRRYGLVRRLRESGHTGLVVLLGALTLWSAVLVGYAAGALLCMPFAVAIAATGLPAARRSGLGWYGPAVTLMIVLALGVGAALGGAIGRPAGASPLAERETWAEARAVWIEGARIARDYPLVGAGLGSFAAIHPYYKDRDEATTTAWSSLAQWWAESGVAGMVLAGLACGWCVLRLAPALRRVGAADRPLACGLAGAIGCCALVSVVHWTVELPAVALAASAVGGTCHRWLAGGTDLFVERA